MNYKRLDRTGAWSLLRLVGALLFLLTVAFGTLESAASSEEQDLGVLSVVLNPANGCYYELVEVFSSPLDWSAARDAAAARSYEGTFGHLAAITDAEEEAFVVNTFPEIDVNYVWLGASDKANEGNWQWITGEDWSYADWALGEPNGGVIENCLDFGDYSTQWNDESCERPLNFYLVEYSLGGPSVIAIDIKPCCYPNSINLSSRGVVPVAVLTTCDFDASTVDPATVLFADAYPQRWAMEDVDYDGDLDLVFHFKTLELNLDEYSTEASLTGQTFDGQAIQGTDDVRILVPPGPFKSPLSPLAP
ncbi:MAG: C-type lectin domain-containing protein [Anaerolineae bacterium]|jgi:hypothetical protein